MFQKEFFRHRLCQFLEGDECCVVCGKESLDLLSLIKRNDVLCHNCRQSMRPILRNTKIEEGTIVLEVQYGYVYHELLGTYLYQCKGVGDVRMAPLFLDPVLSQLEKQYRDYTILRMPSWHEDDKRRGFNHVDLLFSGIGKEILCPFQKIRNEKQASKHKKERKDIGKAIALDPSIVWDKTNKILLVDDVMTTGSTLFHAANLLQMQTVEVLVVALHEALSK